ncbi:MAG: winged helix-turn-helix domain-containing protein [Spirochaetales bacterium]|nr:winged helix-turn-helix domain-containing protein [Spirochaetales bacterium]
MNLVSKDKPLIEKIKYYFKDRNDIHLIYTKEPLPIEDTEIYIAPVCYIEVLSAKILQNKGKFPIIFYGNISFLRKAFLADCSDYLKDPWTVEELSLRLTKLLQNINSIYTFTWGSISFSGTDIISEKGTCSLSYQELRIIKTLIRHRGDVVPREVLFYSLWNKPGFEKSRVIDMHISSIRKKLQCILLNDYSDEIIISVRGIGYMMK